ncbi:AbrB/MazE/SpoVT family DNA-binding domain-containing protein [Microbacterium sp.]|uniref:AbrB/MazE/SpoVT family DNA-binding domain-containing protein n=1 Tax=Microbacterium sp. TaxID=51671 RepID=UPI0031FE5F19|nr:AbrB/MazE/SpoVT family DNA-binding domain-containing protein [Microbacterium sp.]
MTNHEIVAVTYDIDAQRNAPGRFTVPAEVCDPLGIGPGSRVAVTIRAGGTTHPTVQKMLKGDREPSPVGEMADWIKPGERIRVTVSKA